MTNRASFACTFHDQPATGRLTLGDDGRWTAAFLLDGGKVCWPFQGRWTRHQDTILLTTPHGFVHVVLTLNPDLTLTFIALDGGFINVQLAGARSTALPYEPAITKASNA
jgi:hypothetical protein